MEFQKLGATSITVSPLGMGTWQWGDTMIWQYGGNYGPQDVRAAFDISLAAGINFFDSAEIYGRGDSERILGQFVAQMGPPLAAQAPAPLVIATKFAPLPTRLTVGSLHRALDASLKRLGMSHVDLYQIHFPYSLIPIKSLMNGLADAVAEGKVRAVGVSNYSAEQMQRAYDVLARRGVPLASNQVEYSLLKRTPQVNGVLDTCRKLNVTLIAYSPIAQGLLTGKYTLNSPVPGVRRFMGKFHQGNLAKIQPLIGLLREIGQAHTGKTPAQVALNWLMAQPGVIPIPGAKNGRQAAENAGALGWSLSLDECATLDKAAERWKR
ncbi:MAG: aldo/keto reductase [Chloroflexi bacterium]|nr:aldo/keto reductase [Chloroflexota bacterium]